MDVPTYGLDQIAALRDVEIHDGRGVVTLRGVQVSIQSLNKLTSELFGPERRTRAPDGYVALRTALARFPGEKPWGRVVRAMLSGEIDFHVVGKQSIRRIMVDPTQVAGLEAVPIGPGPLGVTRVTVRDACEILCAGYDEVARAIREKGLEVSRHERERGIERAALAEFVGEVAFTGEAAAYKRRTAISLRHEFVRLGVPRLHTAWCREALVDLGMVMPLPTMPVAGTATCARRPLSPHKGLHDWSTAL